MKFWLKGNVTIPARPHTVGGLIGWARGVNRALVELRDRKIEGMIAQKKASISGPFCKVYQDGENWKLLGGTVTCGAGTETIADITIGTIATPPADGTFYWLACVVDANEEDDVLLPGGTLTDVTVDSGETLPGNTIPVVGAIEGTIHISLGEWMNGKFITAGCGNIQISHCPGSLTYQRDNYYGYYGYYGY